MERESLLSNSPAEDETERDYPPNLAHTPQDIRILKLKFLLLTICLIVLMAVVIAGGLSYIVVLLTKRGQYDPVSKPSYDFYTERQLVPMNDDDETLIGVTLMKPKSVSAFTREIYPVILEVNGDRKDDTGYFESYTRQVYFTERGYVYITMDPRGTGASGGSIGTNVHDKWELSDISNVMKYLAKQDWTSGYVGLYGRGRGAETALLLAKRRTWDDDLSHIDALYISDVSDDFFYGGNSYLDGILRLDQYIIRLDHLNGLPAYPFYKIDENYFEKRVRIRPWVIEHLKHQKDSTYWNTDPDNFDRSNLSVPIYFVGGLFHPLLDYSIDIPLEVHEKLPFCKVVVGPWNETLAYNSRIGPTYDDLHEGVRWFDTWLKNRYNELQDEAKIQFFVRQSNTNHDPAIRKTPGEWNTFKLGEYPFTDYYLCTGGLLHTTTCFDNRADPLSFDPAVGVEMDRWWGDPKGPMNTLDKKSLIYTSTELPENLTLVGKANVTWEFTSTSEVSHWMIRLEEVLLDGTVVYVTGRAFSGNQFEGSRTAPIPLKDAEQYTVWTYLRWTTYTFSMGNRIRLSITNTQFPSYWPQPESPTILLKHGNSFIRIPNIPPIAFSAPPPFVSLEESDDDDDGAVEETSEEGFQYDASAYPRNYWTEQSTKDGTTVTWTSDIYSNINSTLIANYLGYSLWQSSENSVTEYRAYGASVYVFNVGADSVPDSDTCYDNSTETETDTDIDSDSDIDPDTDTDTEPMAISTISFLENVTNSFDFPQSPNPINLTCSDLPNVDMAIRRWFQVKTFVQIFSDPFFFNISFIRWVSENNTDPMYVFKDQEVIARDFQ